MGGGLAGVRIVHRLVDKLKPGLVLNLLLLVEEQIVSEIHLILVLILIMGCRGYLAWYHHWGQLLIRHMWMGLRFHLIGIV